ncbi:MAG: DUF6600 domain-containing protein, partial [Rubrivivax sp.]
MHRGLGLKALVAAALACAGLLLGGAAAMAQDDPPGRVGRIAALQGEVWVYDDEQGEWQSAERNRPFTQGDRLSTAADGRVAVRIGSTTLQLGGSAEIDAVRLDDQHLQFALLRGSLALRVRSDEVAAELEVLTPEGRFVPLRSGLYRIDRQDETSFAGVWRGELQFLAPELARTLQPGQRAEFWRDGPQRIARSQWLSPLDDEFAQAVQRDDQADTRSAATIFVSPEMTGVEDLDRYGGWQQHPEYGAVWTPASVVVGWVPYRYGHWAWLRPWGWTWVDDAPWGFAPFHYGRWLSWGGRWCWAPGPRVARPVFAPALVAWVGGPQFNVVVGSRPVPAVGWVPLAPREHYRPGYRASTGYLNRLNTHPQQPGLPPPGHGNRAVPGAVTVLPATRLAPRQPVAAAALRADEMVLQQQWRAERFHHDAPGRPAYPARDTARPRMAMPIAAAPTTAGAAAPPVVPPTGRPTRPAPPQPQGPSDAPGHPAQAQLPVQPRPASRPMLPSQPMTPAAPMVPAQTVQSGPPGQGVPPVQAAQPLQPARPMPPAHAPAAQTAQPGAPFGGGVPQAAAAQAAPPRERGPAPATPPTAAGVRPVPPSAQPGATPLPRP